MRLHNALKELLRGSFIQDVVKLSLGTVVGRLIAFAALPVLTRIYSPSDFAMLATYVALVSTISVGACLRFEIAIPLVKTDEEAAEVLALSLLALSVVTLLVLVTVLLIPEVIAHGLKEPGFAAYLWLLPLGVVITGSYSAMQFWATRARRFGDIARTRIEQAFTSVAAMLSLGWLGFSPLGLLLGNILNMGAGGFKLGLCALRNEGNILKKIKYRNLGTALKRNYRYPLFSLPESLFNMVGIQIPVLIISAHAGAEAGFLMLAMQIMAAPMALLGSSISQVYISRASQEYINGTLAPFTISIMKRLVVVGVGPMVLLGAISPFVFPLIFGSNWLRAGEIITWMVPWMIFQFVASPVSMVMYVVGRQRKMLYLTTFGMVIRIAFTIFAIDLDYGLVEAFAVSSAVFYLVCIIIFFQSVKN